LSDQELVNILIRNSLPSFEFLTNFGLNLEILSQCGGHSFPRTHRTFIKEGKITNVGFEIISTLYKYITSIPDNIKVITSAKLIKILINHNNEVIGIKYLNLKTNEIIELLGDAVILASGGYANDKNGLLKEYFPNISNLPTTNGPFALGEGIKLAKEIGADLVLMDQVQIHPTSFIDPLNPTSETNFLAPEALRGSGGIIINSKGKRFVNELGLREQVTNEIFKNCEKLNNTELIVAYLLLNDKAVEIYQASALSFYKSKGFIKEFNNSEEFAKAFHIDPLIIFQTLINYTNYAHIGEDPFGKKNFPVTFSPNEHLYAMIITPAIHYTMGGLRINSKSQVLNSNLKPIKGLFAAGEVTGGIHGKNRLAGNSLLECIVFGRLSSQTAMNFS
jgi:flavocytochrome c